MGKTDQSTHKFQRKSKMGTKVTDKASLSTFVDHNHVMQTLPNDAHSRLTTEEPGTIGEHNVASKVSYLFGNTNLDIVQVKQPSLPTHNASRTRYVPTMLPELNQYNHTELTELTSNGTLSIYSSKVWKDDSVLLALVFVNQDSSAIKCITVKMEDSESVTVSQLLRIQFDDRMVLMPCIENHI